MRGRFLEQDFVVRGFLWATIEHAEKGLKAANEAKDLKEKKNWLSQEIVSNLIHILVESGHAKVFENGLSLLGCLGTSELF